MIIWINGAFGSGKTQTAHELHRRIPHSYVFDPEQAGFYIRKNVPKEAAKADFQDYPMWRESTYSMLAYLADEVDGTILVPMTVVNPQYFQEIIGRLRMDGVTVHHFALCASKETLLQRLRTRGEGKRSWPAQQIDRCIEGLAHDCFRDHLETDQMTIEEVVEKIAAMVNIPLQPDRRGKLRKLLDRYGTQLRHIRFFG
ncbi:AAA family ATPase [Brevibacillus migulae]|uniref:AAA family ATPase n=1 Tax=Brevibacillus migulae TaxID=1644114 RepID=UPI00106E2860|nr:AAA family ATPase [Brevibacillus migulae]